MYSCEMRKSVERTFHVPLKLSIFIESLKFMIISLLHV